MDEVGFKKSYLTRKAEEIEANAEIRRFCGSRETTPWEVPDAQDVDEEGTMRNVSS